VRSPYGRGRRCSARSRFAGALKWALEVDCTPLGRPSARLSGAALRRRSAASSLALVRAARLWRARRRVIRPSRIERPDRRVYRPPPELSAAGLRARMRGSRRAQVRAARSRRRRRRTRTSDEDRPCSRSRSPLVRVASSRESRRRRTTRFGRDCWPQGQPGVHHTPARAAASEFRPARLAGRQLRAPICCRRGAVLLVAHVLAEGCRAAGVVVLLHGDVDHEPVGRRRLGSAPGGARRADLSSALGSSHGKRTVRFAVVGACCVQGDCDTPLQHRRRDGAVATLDRLVKAVPARESRAFVVRGEPGVGKTALLEYVGERATGCRVAHARASRPRWSSRSRGCTRSTAAHHSDEDTAFDRQVLQAAVGRDLLCANYRGPRPTTCEGRRRRRLLLQGVGLARSRRGCGHRRSVWTAAAGREWKAP
jgi:hypothetical protein